VFGLASGAADLDDERIRRRAPHGIVHRINKMTLDAALPPSSQLPVEKGPRGAARGSVRPASAMMSDSRLALSHKVR